MTKVGPAVVSDHSCLLCGCKVLLAAKRRRRNLRSVEMHIVSFPRPVGHWIPLGKRPARECSSYQNAIVYRKVQCYKCFRCVFELRVAAAVIPVSFYTTVKTVLPIPSPVLLDFYEVQEVVRVLLVRVRVRRTRTCFLLFSFFCSVIQKRNEESCMTSLITRITVLGNLPKNRK